ncbi:hypothetical protein B0H15DRAFT_792282 [Mycena belliarum]|uniref:CxC1-like cysteine cluster associated with KDZ transposases domain-containing protein n=1 Tax=Mycena belliarum TaxID=1033014 RepID=A0AAD6XHB5_9AGAR|nr:hypothetical protein B0H15DRAFT_792282 [Mycena belliae]
MIQGDLLVASAYVRQGLMPVSPYLPGVVITIRALETFRVAHLRCPRLGVQAWVRALCDLHGVPPRTYLAQQFTVAFDLYLAIRAVVDKRVQVALARNTPNWRLKNSCPACLYKLEGEEELLFPMLATIDGNNSLKRFWRREREDFDEDGAAIPGASKERVDNREPAGDYYLPREEVDRWAKEGLEEMMKGFVANDDWLEDEDGCGERWQNMKEDVTARAYGMYDETGIFPALCRHNFMLVVVDMVKSGELAKYGFAITNHLMRTLGKLGVGYDIGCKFDKMVKSHPGLAALAAETGFKCLVGAFHGCGHCRCCQVKNLTTYVEGVGLEGLEGCESFFSKSNSLASTTRYATAFHRKQAITEYFKHADTFDAYQSLSLLLCNKYRAALKVKATLPALLHTMAALNIESREVFGTWLEKEKVFLQTLSKEPPQETLEMEYYQKLVNLRLTEVLSLPAPEAPPAADAAGYQRAAAATRAIETQRRHALERRDKSLATVQDLEARLGTERWVPGGEKWEGAATMVGRRRYQRALDALEGLIIARMFELFKVNLAGTGYKLRKHIAKALQARSKAVKAAIERYNAAADGMTPRKPTLSWEQVVDFAFLSDFDLLREGREDIREEPWALPSGRAAMDQHFKLLRADEEIKRLNLEIRRFVTYIDDEDVFLAHHEARLRTGGNPGLAHQVGLHRMERARFDSMHLERLGKLSTEHGFTGSIRCGVSVSKERHEGVARAVGDTEMPAPRSTDVHMAPARRNEAGREEDEDDGEDADLDELADTFVSIVQIAHDDR